MSDNSLKMVMKRLTDLTDGTDLTDKSAYPERSRVMASLPRRPTGPTSPTKFAENQASPLQKISTSVILSVKRNPQITLSGGTERKESQEHNKAI